MLGLTTLALLFAVEKYAPHAPAPLLAVVLGIAASAFFGFASLGIATVGEIPPDRHRFIFPISPRRRCSGPPRLASP